MKYNPKHPPALVMAFGFALTALNDDSVCATSRMSYTYLIFVLHSTRNVSASIH